MHDKVTRAEVAKMLSQYATNILGATPDANKDCSAFAKSISSYDKTMQDFMTKSCQLNIMGIKADNSPLKDFMPNNYVTRAEFGTAISRILWGSKYENNDEKAWYK
jgi:hypothetical protein